MFIILDQDSKSGAAMDAHGPFYNFDAATKAIDRRGAKAGLLACIMEVHLVCSRCSEGIDHAH